METESCQKMHGNMAEVLESSGQIGETVIETQESMQLGDGTQPELCGAVEIMMYI
ncbi:hypothetical protein I3842_11G156500 [Carya illinoinensis]|uniref:Uncharacterized protein n=1 Tax=Carya illinoinensis TaxID=32201 RepID=A0A922DQS8_CARIL|nr:hypothetical protein I3842_11G156500 [Carya illinoinensis]